MQYRKSGRERFPLRHQTTKGDFQMKKVNKIYFAERDFRIGGYHG